MPILKVALDVPVAQLFDYQVEQADEADVGLRVLVPFGRQRKVGLVWAVVPETEYERTRLLRPAESIWRDLEPIGTQDRALLKFCSDYYHYPLGRTVLAALPPGLKRVGGWVEPRRKLKLRPPASALPTGLSAAAGFQSKGQGAAPNPLNFEQTTAWTKICVAEPGHAVHLLFGITGSGKTDVYLAVIRTFLERGLSILVLVPEISLTPQLERRFQAALPEADLVSLHSGVGEKERVRRWIRGQRGQARVILGTRSAVFCPMPRMGLIVVDEEHDGSYKQQDGLRYHARDVAIFRAHQLQIPIVLGSATPSLESWWNVQKRGYIRTDLTRRAQTGARPPAVRLIAPKQWGNSDQVYSPVVRQALQERLARAEQCLVFLNRRGFAPILRCEACGWTWRCSHCTAHLVVHQRPRRLQCHHCGRSQAIPQHCHECSSARLETWGEGTQQVEARLIQDFPGARIRRIDSDSLTTAAQWDSLGSAVRAGEVDLLVGTQMLAKGHDFPGLTLVVALGVDGGLHSSDFRAQERMFAQLMQVAGRAGRASLAGEVLLETRFAQHPVFGFLQRQDYPGFAEYELHQRQTARFPPLTYLAVLRAQSQKSELAQSFMREAWECGRDLISTLELEIYDPVPALLARRAGMHRFQLTVQSHSRSLLQSFLRSWELRLAQAGRSGRVKWAFDVDPVEL